MIDWGNKQLADAMNQREESMFHRAMRLYRARGGKHDVPERCDYEQAAESEMLGSAEFVRLAASIARGHAPLICGRRFNMDQYLICDILASHHQMRATGVEADKWQEFREVVLKTRLSVQDRNEIYEGEKK